MPTYRITYAHTNGDKHGYAMCEVDTDAPFTEDNKDDELQEIARSLGREFGYSSVGIMKVELKVAEDVTQT